MVKKHIASISAPKSWPIKRKAEVFLMRPMPGRSFSTSLPLGIILRDLLHLTTTTKESKKVLKDGKILVNKKKRDEVKFPVGFMDVLEIPDASSIYRFVLNKQGKLMFQNIDAKESSFKPCKIVGKTSLNGGKMQVNLDDGTNILADNKNYKVGDTLVIEYPELKVKEHLKLEKGAFVYITAGTKVGQLGTFEGLKSFVGGQPDNIIVKTSNGTIETRKEYALVVGTNGKSVIKLE